MPIKSIWYFLGQAGFKHATDSGYWGRGTYFSVSMQLENFELVVIYTLATSHDASSERNKSRYSDFYQPTESLLGKVRVTTTGFGNRSKVKSYLLRSVNTTVGIRVADPTTEVPNLESCSGIQLPEFNIRDSDCQDCDRISSILLKGFDHRI